jgi:DEAD/DEAH box helicase
MPTSFSFSTWRERRHTLLIAPTGGGKTLAGFLPSLVDLNGQRAKPQAGIHTLYVSPLKALAVDIARNLTEPVAEMGQPITLETRTPSRRQRQRLSPPNILLTTLCHRRPPPGDAGLRRLCRRAQRARRGLLALVPLASDGGVAHGTDERLSLAGEPAAPRLTIPWVVTRA